MLQFIFLLLCNDRFALFCSALLICDWLLMSGPPLMKKTDPETHGLMGFVVHLTLHSPSYSEPIIRLSYPSYWVTVWWWIWWHTWLIWGFDWLVMFRICNWSSCVPESRRAGFNVIGKSKIWNQWRHSHRLTGKTMVDPNLQCSFTKSHVWLKIF